MTKVTLPIATAFVRLGAPEFADVRKHIANELADAREQASLS